MIKSIRKAVFPVAGFGARFLPATKAMPKELLPIINKPLIQYAVEEAIAAGIDTLIFITGRSKRAIEDHFDNNYQLEAVLRARGKFEQAEMINNILPKGVECIFIRQPEQLGLGHAVLCAERVVEDEAFAVLLADDFLIKKDSAGVMVELVEAYNASGKTQLSVMELDGPDISKYGVIKPNGVDGSVAGLVEKPNIRDAPSNLACIGRYVLTSDIFEILKQYPTGVANEIQLTDAINVQANNGNVEAITLKGHRFDCGSVSGYIDAIKHVANLDHRK